MLPKARVVAIYRTLLPTCGRGSAQPDRQGARCHAGLLDPTPPRGQPSRLRCDIVPVALHGAEGIQSHVNPERPRAEVGVGQRGRAHPRTTSRLRDSPKRPTEGTESRVA